MKAAVLRLTALSVFAVSGLTTVADDGGKPELIKLSEGKITLPAPAAWQRKQPRTRIVEHEFAAKAVAGDAANGRVTIMGAGGGVEANIARWIGQFEQADGSSTKDKAKTEKSKVGEATVHVVDITGTYLDRPGGPFAGGKVVPRKKYRMLGAIIVTPKAGHYFVKLLGPEKTIAANAKPFREMLQGLKIDS